MFNIIYTIVNAIIRAVGMWMLFPKCNVKSIWAIVPIANEYKLAQCADEEDWGAIWCISSFLQSLFLAITTDMMDTGREGNAFFVIAYIISLVFTVIDFIYGIRIYNELCNVFGKRKIWTAIWVACEPAAALIWGVSKKFQPIYIAEQEEVETSGSIAKRLDQGLTINIEERAARRAIFLKKVLLKDIHMNIEPGKMVLLLGGSGAGKTTFINAVTGYEKADASVVLNGKDVYKEFDKVIYDIGIVPQQELIRGTDTVSKTLMDAATLRMPSNIKKKDRKARVEEVMDIFGLSPIKNNIISKQSGGQKKRISIATEYISDPSLFILDEPDSGLDGILARELMQKLHDISREGKIVIVVTHTPDRVIDLFDEVIVLAKDNVRTGRLVFKGSVEDARDFFGVESMEEIVRAINRPEEGGLGRTEELLKKYNDMNREVACIE